MLDYAERNLVGTDPKGKKYLSVFVNENHEEFLSFVKQHGYLVQVDENRSMAGLPISASLPQANLPKGFLLSSLAEDCNWKKVNEVLWRGFDHPGDAPASVSDFEERRRMFDTPSARRELKIIVKAPDGNYASLCGFFYEPVNRFAYIEPMATDPDYRRLGLGKAVVLEGLKRCESFGARESYVWNDLPFYRALGFKVVSTTLCWKKEF
jgi:ribosomal protein S18 acetylase RimI-like enzyme